MVLRGLLRSGYKLYVGGYLTATNFAPVGTNVFEKEWDLLIVLDACRVDTLRAVASEYSFLDDIGSIRSVGSTSDEWLTKTFTQKHRETIKETAYVTANPHTTRVLDSDNAINHPGSRFFFGNWNTVSKRDLQYVDEVYTYGWVQDSAVPPRTVTDRAISVSREQDPARLIVHYLQPHRPFLETDQDLHNTWERLYNGELDVEDVQKAYRQNLKLVLDDVSLLLSNVEADRAVITADHGEAFGEFGKFGHGAAFLHPSVKRVPWAETSAEDTGTHEPSITHRTIDEKAQDVSKNRLRELGYL